MQHKVTEVRFGWWQRLLILFGAKVTIYVDGPANAVIPKVRLKVEDFL